MFKKICVCLIIVVLAVGICIFRPNVKVDAAVNQFEEESGIEIIGRYEEVEKQNVEVKVYISEEMKRIYEEQGKTYYTEVIEDKFLWFTIRTRIFYYEYVQQYMDVTTSTIELKNDINSLIYIVTKLEEYARDYLISISEEESTIDQNNRKVTNLVIGYIRTFNSNYHNASVFKTLTWSVVAGYPSEGFVNYIEENDKSSFKIKDYFAFFCSPSTYNYTFHGDIDENKLCSKYLIDTVNPNRTSLNKIDLIHMFATIDGTYDFTENCIITFPNNFQRDISGWAGDLQTFTKDDISLQQEANNIGELNYYNDYTNGESNDPVELIDWVNYTNNSEVTNHFSNSDLLGDIDAMNIVKFYLDAGADNVISHGRYNNLISSALTGYYNFVEFDNTNNYNRYKLFIESMAMDSVSSIDTSFDKFKEKVYFSLVLEENNDEIVNLDTTGYYSLEFYLLTKSLNYSGLPSLEDRIYAANLFIDYIYEMSTVPTTIYVDGVNLDCHSDDFLQSKELLEGQRAIVNINILCDEYFEFRCESIANIDMKLYSHDGELIDDVPIELNNGRISWFTKELSAGRYVLEVKYNDENEYGFIDFKFKPLIKNERREIVLGKTVNVMTHLHNSENYLNFATSNADYYNIKVVMTSIDENVAPSSRLVLKDYQENIINECEFKSEVSNANEYTYNLFFYANRFKSHYIDFTDLTSYIDECYITVEPINEIKLDTVDNITLENNILIGDSINNWNVSYNGVYNLSLSGTNAEDVVFVIMKKTTDGFENIYQQSLTEDDFNYNEELEFSINDELYIGYLNGNGKGDLTVSISRVINEEFTIYTDPSFAAAGSEVNINNGDLRGTEITTGFTRICYLGSDAPNPTSRYTYYNWYSTDESVAIVSAYGTITAVSPGTTIIQCVYKNNTSVVAYLEIEVIEDILETNNPNGENDIYITYGMDCRVGGTESGTEVTSGKGEKIQITQASLNENFIVNIHNAYTRLICLGSESPNSSVQAFNWQVLREFPTDTGMVTVSQFGTIKGITNGYVTVIGTYKYNSRFKVKIRIQVLPNF